MKNQRRSVWKNLLSVIGNGHPRGFCGGGHAMVFTDTDGQMYIAFHSPDTATDDRREIPVFLKIEEKDGTLKAVKNWYENRPVLIK